MTRLKIIGITLITIITLTAALYYTSNTLLLRSFVEIEHEQMTEDLRRIDSAIRNYRDTLSLQLADWAEWDDTYFYMLGENPEYTESNLGLDSLVTLEINYMAFIGPDESVIYADGVDLEEEIEISSHEPVKEILNKIKIKGNYTDRKTSGVLTFEEQVLFFEAQPVTQNDGTGEYVGLLIFARYLDEVLLESITELTQSEIIFALIDGENMTSEMKGVINKIKTHHDYVMEPVGSNEFTGFTTISNNTGELLGIIQTTAQRDIYLRGIETVRTFAFLASGVILMFGITVILLFERLLLRRLFQLTKDVENIDVNRLETSKIDEKSFDEIGTLAKKINNLLQAISDAQTEEKRARKLEKEATAELKKALEKSEKLNKLVIGREEKMIEMKKEIEDLKGSRNSS